MGLGCTCTDFTSLDPGCREFEGFGADQGKRYDCKVAVAHSGLDDASTGLHVGAVLPSVSLSGGCAMGESQFRKVGVQGSSQRRGGLKGV